MVVLKRSVNGCRGWRLVNLKRQFSSQCPPSPPLRAYARLRRDLVSVQGPDAPKFLNGLITNKLVDQDYDTFGIYAGFLNSKGRILADAFIHPTHYSTLFPEANRYNEPSFLIDCDPQTSKSLLGMLNMYKLRAKVDIQLLDPQQLSVWETWDDTSIIDSFPLDISNASLIKPYCPSLVGATDSRAPGFGLRLVLPASETPMDVFSEAYVECGEISESTVTSYNIRRLVYGIPEGVHELIPGSSLPLDSCMDYMGGIDFEKGCYVGQELTIRSHHHGVVRKRIIPVTLHPNPEEETDLEYDPDSEIANTVNSASLAGSAIMDISETLGDTRQLSRVTGSSSPFGIRSTKSNQPLRSSGTLLTAIGNVGLAMVRLEHFGTTTGKFAIQTPVGNVYVKGYLPFWWPNNEPQSA
jgi:folate-binding protein YgfZ